jgi:uncharacterized repeat protein (TIGR01451 family)
MKRFTNPHLKMWFCLLTLAAGLLAVAAFSRSLPTFRSEASSGPAKQQMNGYSKDISVQLETANNPHVNLNVGRALLTDYVGSTAATEALRENQVEALALASEDFDEDGIKDIIAAYASATGGMVTLQRGNSDAIYPNTPEAQQRKVEGVFTDVPFFAEAQVIELSQRPDFISAGDFDGDGHKDLVIATAKDNRLSYLSGNGKGNFKVAMQVDLSGFVTALECGDVNRRDGLPDLVIGIVTDDRAKALVFESPMGAMHAKAEIIDLPDAATAFAIASVDEDYPVDIAIAAGKELLLVKGRDRKLSYEEVAQGHIEPVHIKRRSFGFKIRSVVAGEFSEAMGRELALLTDDGSVLIVEKPGSNRRILIKIKKIAKGDYAVATCLISVRISKDSTENLLTLDSTRRQLHILSTDNTAVRKGQKGVTAQANSSIYNHMRVDGEPVAALPMRLNADSLSDLVILRRGQSALTITPSSTQANIVVNSVADSGSGSLREAIILANSTIDADQINFDMGMNHTINLMSPLPAISNPLTIDGTTQAGFSGTPIVELNYSAAGAAQAGLLVNSPNCTIRGLVINRVAGDGIRLNESGATIEGNFIGTNAAGDTALPNSDIGINVVTASLITIGGSGTAARNLVSGNMNGGIEISGIVSTSNNIFGNIIGPNLAGTASLSGGDGIRLLFNATGNTIGGLASQQRNLISGNATGIDIVGIDNLIQGNFIGVDVTGNLDLGNTNAGIAINDSSGTSIGGVVAGARNIISGNDGPGIFANGSSDGLIQGNFVGMSATGMMNLANSNEGIRCLAVDTNIIGGTVAGAANTIAFNLGAGIRIIVGTNNAILGNSFLANDGLGINLSDDGVTPNDAGDTDGGPNNTQNFPILDSANQEAGNTRVTGVLQSEASKQYRIEFYSSAGCDGSGNGEGERFLGFTMATTNGAGDGSFNVLLPPVVAGQVITATATDPDNNTSEFSPCATVLAGPGTADLSVSKTAAPTQVQAGTLVTYTITIKNSGPDAATNVTLNEFTPANTTFRSLNAPAGWVCNTPAQGAAGNITCTTPVMLPKASAVFTLSVRVNASTANGTSIKNTVKVTTATSDLNPINDSASATITVFNNCILNCPVSITRNSESNQCGATITYAAPTGSGACGGVVCLPPSGSFFQRGTTTVNCSANSGPGCSFTVTINDVQPPTISCPANVTAQESSAGSGVAIVNYSLPTTSDNCQGVNTVCVPPAGSTFPVGITRVNCTATDAGGNSVSCSFNVTVQGGAPQLEVTIPGGGPAIVFGANSPVPARRKPAKEKNNPCSIFSVENKGFTPVEIILDSVVRTGADVDSRRIGDASDGGLYSVRRLVSGGGEVLIPIGGSVTIAIGEKVDFCVKFNPLLPIVPASSNNIPAALVLADRTTSRVTFRVTRGNPFSVNAIANVASDLVLIDPLNTRRPAVLTFERIDNEYVLTFSLFDANQDVQRMKIELLDGSGSVVASFDIDLVVPIRERNLVRGQSFTIVQRFTGANDNPQITAARLTVSDALNTVTGTANLTNNRTASIVVGVDERQSILDLPGLRIRK